MEKKTMRDPTGEKKSEGKKPKGSTGGAMKKQMGEHQRHKAVGAHEGYCK